MAIKGKHKEYEKYVYLKKWMYKKKAQINKMDLKFYGQNVRGVEASENIQKDNILMYIPDSLVIKADLVIHTKIGRQII